MESLLVDDLRFEVRRSDRRRSLQITVDRGGELLIAAPASCAAATMEGFVREKKFWIYSKLAEKQALRDDGAPREYVSGEGFRWGSCSVGGRLNFHWRTIVLLPRVVEYVVVHELMHLLEAHHTTAFWARVERAMPDYAARKAWLAEHGADAMRV